jgi:hypothetical protein
MRGNPTGPSGLRRHADGRRMDLATRLPNGEWILTVWDDRQPFYGPAQLAHAKEHRERVRARLAEMRRNR